MIKFFRKIRQRLLTDGKFFNYLLYAIGEVALVMIGILLALQVNNWNQNRLDQRDKKVLLSALHAEFQENKTILEKYRAEAESSINAYITLMNLIGDSEEELNKHNLDSLFFSALQANELAFADNAVNDIVQSGRLNLFKNDEITGVLNQWNSLSEIRKNRINKSNDWNNNQMLPFLVSYISFKEMDANGNFEWTGKSKVKPNYYTVFQKIELENYLDNALWFWKSTMDRVNETETLIDQIINVTQP